MKKILLIASVLFFIQNVNSQTTAQDWTLNDCASNSHTLFSYLDNEEVVVMEFGMGCGSCYTAGGALMDLKANYAVSNPGMVNFFYLDYWSGNTCSSDVNPMLSAHAFDAGFENTLSQKNYYMTGSPMPAVVIVAGSNHTVIYEKNSFAMADTTTMINAIDNFFATVGMTEISNLNVLNLFPNPATSQLNLMLDLNSGSNDVQLEIIDITGKIVLQKSNVQLIEGVNNLMIDTEELNAGNYFLRLITSDEVYNKPFSKN